MAKIWQFVPHPGVEAVLKKNKTLSITSETNRHFYVPFGRDDTNFRNQPARSSFDLSLNSSYEISTDLEVTGNVSTQLAVVEYTIEGDRVLMGTADSIVYIPSPEAIAVTVALRIKGIGSVEMHEPKIRSAAAVRVDDLEETIDVSGARSTIVTLEAFSLPAGEKNAALAVLEFIDHAGNLVLPTTDLPVHPKLGTYSYISCEALSGTSTNTISTSVPLDAVGLRIRGKSWKKNTGVYISGGVDVELDTLIEDSENESINGFLGQIPKHENLIVLYTTAPILGHQTLALRPNRLAAEYLKMGAWVVFFPFSKVPPGSEYVSSRCRQYSLDSLNEFLNEAADREGLNNVFICSSFPDLGAVTAIDLLRLRGWKTIYEVRDDMEEFNRVGYSKWFHPRLESRVSRTVDRIVTVSPRLAEKMNILRGEETAIIVPNAVSDDLAQKGENLRSTDRADFRNDAKTVGYIGHLTPSWFDWPLITRAAEKLPNFQFEIVGHGAPPGITLPSNVDLLGPRNHDEFLELAVNWKVGLIPFKASTLTTAVDPNKIYEYLAVGLRVVTSRMGAVDRCPSTWVYESEDEFVNFIKEAVSLDYREGEFEHMNNYVANSLWSARAKTMFEVMGLSK